ncbi:hypothetical protein WR25_22367 [Diploscapter pachys]|uniref:F-box domain-containing protein n=1 Tax=Diploscapter pachys TaxID=2018661 RepID=A0A2A2KNU3_9BILA|nr:hypothetical protein WR25_22367 [Diploscapter pachys]
MLLNTLPVELVTEILLNLPIRALIAIVQANRHLYNIAHAEKSIVQHRFDYKQAFSLELVITDSNSQESALICECGFPRCKTINLKIFRAENEYKAKESDDEYEVPNTNEPPGLTLKVWKACECRKTKQKMRIDAYDLLKSSTFLTTMDEYIRTGIDHVSYDFVNDVGERDKVATYHEVLKTAKKVDITGYTLGIYDEDLVAFFSKIKRLYLCGADKLTSKQKMIFDIFPVEIIEKCLVQLPIIDLISAIKINRRLYNIAHAEKCLFRHRLVKQHFDLSLMAEGVKNARRNRNDDDDFEICDCQTDSIEIAGYPLAAVADDGDLMRTFTRIARVYIPDKSKITLSGIAKFIKNIYDNKQGKARNIRLNVETKGIHAKELMVLIPTEAYEVLEDDVSPETAVKMTNKFDEKWKIAIKETYDWNILIQNSK